MQEAGINKIGMALRREVRACLDYFLPPRCVVCYTVLSAPPENQSGLSIMDKHNFSAGAGAASQSQLCANCWRELDFIDGPICYRTGAPLPFSLGAQTVSLRAMLYPPIYDRARSALHYGGTTRALILKLKFYDQTQLAHLMAGWMMRAGQDLLADADFLLPVPLHWTRLLGRRYNQSAELARNIARLSGIPMRVGWLKRIRPTPQQIGLTRAQRRQNLRHAFAITDAGRAALAGKNPVVIDDVLTTGATANACAMALRRAGAAHIGVLTLAQVIRQEVVYS